MGDFDLTGQSGEEWVGSACTLDHDGCVVCSDAGIQLRVVSLTGGDALCEDLVGNQTLIAVDLVQPVRIGDVLLTHGGVAIGRAGSTAPVLEGREGDDEVRE